MKCKLPLFFCGILSLLFIFNVSVLAEDNASKKNEPTINVDIPVVIKKAKVVFDVGRVSFTGDMPVALRYINLLAKRFKDQGIEGQIIAVFYGDGAYLTLNDQAYNAHRKVTTGNPYKALIMESMAQGVQFEECAVAMKFQKISNSDLLQGVKVNSGGNLRFIQLMQEGFVRLQP